MRCAYLRDLDAEPLPEPLQLREASAADERALAELLSAAFDANWTAEDVARSLTRCPLVHGVYVIEQDGRLLATASARLDPERFPSEGYLHWVAAHPQARGMRLGRAVSIQVLQRFRDLGCRSAVLETDDHRLPAIKTYLGLGFQPVLRHPRDAERWAAVLAHVHRIGER